MIGKRDREWKFHNALIQTKEHNNHNALWIFRVMRDDCVKKHKIVYFHNNNNYRHFQMKINEMDETALNVSFCILGCVVLNASLMSFWTSKRFLNFLLTWTNLEKPVSLISWGERQQVSTDFIVEKKANVETSLVPRRSPETSESGKMQILVQLMYQVLLLAVRILVL